ncbi:DUF6777 domain-containing protein [Streptomyces sp. NPDC057426]|uniref:DUF6777 domain-containing protein n=1 Tax=Streptomyces sp. NPDC057426 TaxID=3346128 RepID=UPI003697FBE6
MASIAAALVAAIALVVVLTRPDGDGGGGGGSGGGEVFLQNASAAGPDPFTESTADAADASLSPAPLPSATRSAEATATRSVSGSAAGLYGGTRNAASCDVERQVSYLADQPAKNAAFASTLGMSANEVPGYLRSLTPLQLRVDTRVTNHGFRDGTATSYQAVLQAGTAVLVDDRGVPRVRCACGNPLTPPVAQQAPKTTGTPWAGYQPSQVVVVAPSVTVVNVFIVYDPETDGWFAREPGDTGGQDKPTSPPTAPPSPSVSDSVTESPTSPSPSVSTPSSPPAPESPASPDAPGTSTPSEPATGDTATDGTTGGTTDQSASVVSPQAADGSAPVPRSGPDSAMVAGSSALHARPDA